MEIDFDRTFWYLEEEEMQNEYYFGIDIGGTITKIGLVDKQGNVYDKRIFATSDFNSKQKLLKCIVESINEISNRNLNRKERIKGIGIGVPGLVNFNEGLIYNLTNLSGWKNVKITEILKKQTGVPVLVDNDVNVIALGEYMFGAGRGTANMICLTLGTGIGGGLIISGKLYRGSSYSAGEIGHFPINKKGPLCNCGSRGCLERYIGNKYFVKQVIKEIKSNPAKSKILKLAGNSFNKITPEIIAQAAEKGDNLAKAAWEEMAFKLGMVLAGVINIFNPGVIVIGGGMAEAGKVLFEPLKTTIEKFSLKIPCRTVKIRKARLGNEGGIIGAASLFFNKNLRLNIV
ncbi:MAG: ROK family protein [Candidatus Omnitrophota bacterium]